MSRSKLNQTKMTEAKGESPSADPYAKLADIYDSETSNRSIQAFYREWRTSLTLAVRKYGIKVRVMVDLACGTGNTTIPWTRRRGWTVIGIDRSRAMLREAKKKSRRVRWIRQDLRTLALRERADVVTCHFDALSHILVPQDLQKVFFNVARILNERGLFQFDLNTEHWFQWLSDHEKLYRLPPNYLVSTNEYDSGRRIATFHQLWFVKRQSFYEKRDISVQERAYTTGEIQRLLKKAGLRLLKLKIQRRLEGKAIRMLYLVQKPKSAEFKAIGPVDRLRSSRKF